MMKQSHAGKRIGFVLATIHTGSSLNLWLKLASRAAKGDSSFFIFPGGVLNRKDGSEFLRNSVYRLANSTNLDGLISWASTIGGEVSQPELEEFHTQFTGMPLVTIGQKIREFPSIEFDAYSGMKELVLHFVQVHGAQRIAFIRGPENHASADDRFRAYKDALAESEIEFSESLVSSCWGWDDGAKAAEELCAARGLAAGKDFDALIASSDLMAIAAINWLSARGVKVPHDCAVAGFNDDAESRIFLPSVSTVHMPAEGLGEEALSVLLGMFGGGTAEGRALPSYPVIRESCGCHSLKSWSQASASHKIKVKTRKQLYDEVTRALRFYPQLDKARLDALFDALFDNDRVRFFNLAVQSLSAYFKNGGGLEALFNIDAAVRNATCLDADYVAKVGKLFPVLVPQVQARVFAEERYNERRLTLAMGALKGELLSVHTRAALFQSLARHLPRAGICRAAVVLYGEDGISRYVGGFTASGEVRTEEVPFPGRNLMPEQFAADFTDGVFVVQPLFTAERALGYLIADFTGSCRGLVYEDLRAAVSNTLHGIFQFEEVERARQVAEQAEFEKTEFFANVGSDLCDPLKDLSAKVTQMDNNVNNGVLDADILDEQLIFLKSQIEAQLEKIETLVDLTRSQVDDLPMDKRLFDVRQILPASAAAGVSSDIPLLFGDAGRLKKALQSLSDTCVGKPALSIGAQGITISFESVKFDWQKPELILAEKIVLLQYGKLSKSEKKARVVLPWPNLAGMPPARADEEPSQVFALSQEGVPTKLLGVPVVPFVREAVDSIASPAVIVWRPDDAPIDEWVKVYGMRHDEKLFRAPLLCYSRNLIGHNFLEMLEQKVRTQRVAPVLFVDALHTRYGTWATDSNSVSIASMDEFDKIIEEISPSLIVFEKIDEASIKKIRQNRKTVLTPVLVLPDTILSEEQVDLLCAHPKIILCNRGAAESEQFDERIHGILGGDEILPPHTGALVKKAILYLNKNASQQIVRWKLADTVHVSEDYLTRIFHKEIGLSLWEYLNRYRIYMATKMLLETNDTIYEIAENSGFQDQAYFCRVFKKIYGIPPGKIRTKN